MVNELWSVITMKYYRAIKMMDMVTIKIHKNSHKIIDLKIGPLNKKKKEKENWNTKLSRHYVYNYKYYL